MRRCAVRRQRAIFAPRTLELAAWPCLFIALWCWKCTMLVVFQNTIIYNPFLPPDARRLEIAEAAMPLCDTSAMHHLYRLDYPRYRQSSAKFETAIAAQATPWLL
ncbi:hypothetical protein ISF_07671 [Cordyceps fumosorosea ARSEF 2679]|uniref:Uncharacterized protein n=1 Tax=Cordyceps fumosorosea (strain ARSEF 2679) TaxID=1081104 RepID=A0A167NY20_CORFA|nr:hypothetical protein ISF_07671 [Cordyceps fumosorosea ARSEF 2679]OAA56073.1 hypothetical protein ISF_07671 [Cordyceps fumosorosea ARSEF 2679]